MFLSMWTRDQTAAFDVKQLVLIERLQEKGIRNYLKLSNQITNCYYL